MTKALVEATRPRGMPCRVNRKGRAVMVKPTTSPKGKIENPTIQEGGTRAEEAMEGSGRTTGSGKKNLRGKDELLASILSQADGATQVTGIFRVGAC